MKQSMMYRVLAVNMQQHAANVASMSRMEEEAYPNERKRLQQLAASAYALAQARRDTAHAWERIEP